MLDWRPGPLSLAELNARISRLREISEADGDELDVAHIPGPHLRYFRLEIAVPGHGAHEATFEYEEWYELVGEAWRLRAYQYELRFQPGSAGRWAEHWHDDVFHRHCEQPGRGPPYQHWEGQPIDVHMARELLRIRYAAGALALPCAELVPLARGRGRRRRAPRKRPRRR